VHDTYLSHLLIPLKRRLSTGRTEFIGKLQSLSTNALDIVAFLRLSGFLGDTSVVELS
jgi:hypothetical protein